MINIKVMSQISKMINYVRKYIVYSSKDSSFRFLNDEQSQQNQTTKQDNANDSTTLEENLDLASQVSQIFFYVLAGVSAFILLILILYSIKLCCTHYKKRSKSKYLQKKLDSQSAISQEENNSNNPIIKNDVESMNQDNYKFEQSQKVILVQHELEKEVSTIDVQNNLQYQLKNNVEDIQVVIENLQEEKQNRQDQKIDSFSNKDEQVEDERNDQYNSIEQEEKVQETYDTQVFHLEQNQYLPPQMTPSFSNTQINFFQFGGSEKLILTQTDESIKTLESLQLKNRENKQCIKKKTLFEYNNQVLQPIQESNFSRKNQQNGSINTVSERCKNQLMDYNKFKSLSDEQKYQQQIQMMNLLLSKQELQNKRQSIANSKQDIQINAQNIQQYNQNNQQLNKQELQNNAQLQDQKKQEQQKNIKEDKQRTEPNQNKQSTTQQQQSDKENKYPIDSYQCLQYKNGLKYMREYESQVISE